MKFRALLIAKNFLEGLGFLEIIRGFKQGHSMGNALFVWQ